MISLQPLHLTHRPSGTWTRLCSTGCFGFLIFLNHAISISSCPSRRGQRPESGGNHIATGGNGQEQPSGSCRARRNGSSRDCAFERQTSNSPGDAWTHIANILFSISYG